MSKCKSCGAEIIWVKTNSGQSIACNPKPVYKYVFRFAAGGVLELTPHSATCQAANQHRRRKHHEQM